MRTTDDVGAEGASDRRRGCQARFADRRDATQGAGPWGPSVQLQAGDDDVLPLRRVLPPESGSRLSGVLPEFWTGALLRSGRSAVRSPPGIGRLGISLRLLVRTANRVNLCSLTTAHDCGNGKRTEPMAPSSYRMNTEIYSQGYVWIFLSPTLSLYVRPQTNCFLLLLIDDL